MDKESITHKKLLNQLIITATHAEEQKVYEDDEEYEKVMKRLKSIGNELLKTTQQGK